MIVPVIKKPVELVLVGLTIVSPSLTVHVHACVNMVLSIIIAQGESGEGDIRTGVSIQRAEVADHPSLLPRTYGMEVTCVHAAPGMYMHVRTCTCKQLQLVLHKLH